MLQNQFSKTSGVKLLVRILDLSVHLNCCVTCGLESENAMQCKLCIYKQMLKS